MKKNRMHTCLTLLVILFPFFLNGQAAVKNDFTLRNAPVLFKKGNKSFQQVLASFRADKPGKVIFYSGNREILSGDYRKGENRFLLTIPAVSKPVKNEFSMKLDNDPVRKSTITVNPPKKWEILFVQHSHTDIGYTRPQSEILAEHMRYIDYALDYCDQTDQLPDEARFRWTCESAWVTREYLRSRPSSQIERFKKRIAEGRIEVTGMYSNMAEISDENLMYDFLQPLREFRKLGIPVKMAMQNDVNGIAWCMPDYFKNTGVKYLVMGINETRSVLPFDKPTCFWWESPSGERLLAFRADHYMTGNFYGIESKAIKPENMLNHLAELEEKNYPFDKIGIQFSGYYTDNAPPSTAACELVLKWNESYEAPKLRLAVGSEFSEYVEKNHAATLPVYRNAWLDWWTDGYGSTSRETAEIRKTQNTLQSDQGLFAMVSMMGGELSPALDQKMDHICENAIFFDEHTCGADESISHPYSENSTRQWLQKGAYAWEALKKATLLNEEALARFQPFLPKAGFPVIYLINPMGWKRSGNVELFIDFEVLPLDRKKRIVDLSNGEEVKAQVVRQRREGAYWVLEARDVPALGYKALKVEVTSEPVPSAEKTDDQTEILENRFYKLVMDVKTGAINSLYDKELNQELADTSNPWKTGQLIRETLPDRNHYDAKRSTVSNVKVEKGPKGEVWESIRITADLEGFSKGTEGKPKGIDAEIRLYRNVKKLEIRFHGNKEILTDPEALYVSFPFALPGGRIVFETIGGSLIQGRQLPGSSTDWNAAQNFVSVRGKNGQVVVVSNEVPLWHFSDFNMGKYDRIPKQGKTWLYSWVMNNYWFTNFRAFQEGGFSWGYQITSTSDTTNTFATNFAWGERNPFLTRTFPAGKNELISPAMGMLTINGPGNAFLVNSRPVPGKNGSVLLHFRELEGRTAEVSLASSVPGKPVKSIREVNVLGEPVGNQLKSVSLKPYEVRFIEIEF